MGRGGPTGKGKAKEDPSTYLRSDKSSKLFEDDKAKGPGLGQFMGTGMTGRVYPGLFVQITFTSPAPLWR